MKKIFFFAACMASMSMFAQTTPTVAFVKNLGENDQVTTSDGNSTTILAASGDTKDTKYNIAAGTVLVSNDKITVKNAFTVDYKNVGMEGTDSAYVKMMIGNQEVDFNASAIQGQTNPTPNPVTGIDSKATPTSGACYLVDVKADGWLVVPVKATPNKNQFAMENYTNGGAATVANSLEYWYACMTNNTTGNAIGNPDGCLQVYFQGNPSSGYILASAKQPYQLYDYAGSGAYSKNGPGFMLVEVFKAGSPYLIGTAGSKMMAAGFAWVSDTTGLVITAKGNVDKNGVSHSDVQLWPYGTNAKIQDCGTKENSYKIDFTAPDEWVKDTLYTNNGATYKKVYVQVTDDVNGQKSYEMSVVGKDTIDGRVYAKDGAYTYTFKSKATSYTINKFYILKDTVTAATYPAETEAVATAQTGDACYSTGTATSNVYPLVACGGTGLDEVAADAAIQGKFFKNGHLYIKKGDMIFDAKGVQVK